MKKYLLLLILISGFAFGQSEFDVISEFNDYRNKLTKYSEINPEVLELENKRNKINENLGSIILESDPDLRKKYVLSKISKDKQAKFLKYSNDEIEKLRSESDFALKAKILLLCKRIDLEYLEYKISEDRKAQAKTLIDNGYNLNDFNNLPEEKRIEILKNLNLK